MSSTLIYSYLLSYTLRRWCKQLAMATKIKTHFPLVAPSSLIRVLTSTRQCGTDAASQACGTSFARWQICRAGDWATPVTFECSRQGRSLAYWMLTHDSQTFETFNWLQASTGKISLGGFQWPQQKDLHIATWRCQQDISAVGWPNGFLLDFSCRC